MSCTGLARTALRARAMTALVAFCLAAALAPAGASAATVTAGFRDFSYGTSVTAPTGQKPESKLWFQDGRWWAVLFNTATRRFEIYGFNKNSEATNAWTTTGTAVDGRRTASVDVKWVGNNKLYVVSHIAERATTTDKTVNVKRFGYTPGATPGTGKYTLETTKTVANGALETAEIERDGAGRLWVTWTAANASGGRSVFVTHTVARDADTDFVAPFVLPVPNANNLSADDIATLIATGGKVGVLWSNQATNELLFAAHADTDGDQTWTPKVLCATPKCPDDHLNIKALDGDGTGQAFAIVKTSLNDIASPPGAPLIVLYHIDMSTLAFDSHTVWTVADDATRGIVLLDKENRDAYAFSAAPCCSGGVVYMKKAPFSDLTFPPGLGTPFIQSSSDLKINNPSSTKQSLDSTTGLLVIAGDDSTRFYLHNSLKLAAGGGGGADTTPPTVSAVTPADGATDVAPGTSVRATFSEAMDPATITSATFTLTPAGGGTPVGATVSYDGASRTATLDPNADLATSTSYTARVTTGVKDVAGNAMAAAKTWSFATAAAEPPPPGAGIKRETTSTVVNTTATSTVAVTKPAGTASGDVLVACLALNGGSVSSTGVPAGWTRIAAVTAITNPHVFGYYKVAGDAEPASYSWTLTGAVANGAGIARYSGVDTTAPLDAAATTVTAPAATSASLPGVTTVTANAMLASCMALNSSSTTITVTPPAGMTKAWDIGGKRHALADGVQAAAGPSGAKTWTFSSAR